MITGVASVCVSGGRMVQVLLCLMFSRVTSKICHIRIMKYQCDVCLCFSVTSVCVSV